MAQLSDIELQGVVIIGYGGDYMMTHRLDLLRLFEEAYRTKRILMVLISQSFPCSAEEPIRKDMADIFQRCGIVPGSDMTLPATLAKLALTLQLEQAEHDEKMRILAQNWEGEIS